MPLEWVAMRYAAQNQAVSGNFEPCIMVPAVTEVCLPQAAHSKVKGFPPCGHPFSWAHGRTAEARRPTRGEQPSRAGGFIRVASLKVAERNREVGHDGASEAALRSYQPTPRLSLHWSARTQRDKPSVIFLRCPGYSTWRHNLK